MPLLSFSIREQIPLLISGKKQQTTRLIRTNSIKEGSKLYCYFKPRQKKMCSNCISLACKIPFERRGHQDLKNYPPCDKWNNYFGKAEVIHVRPFSLYRFILEKWAISDGFENIDRAMDWLDKTHPGWESHMDDFVVITFIPMWF